MKTYLNIKTSQGVETIDELDRSEFNTWNEFKAELKRLIGEYHLVGINVYKSSRCTKDWKQ